MFSTNHWRPTAIAVLAAVCYLTQPAAAQHTSVDAWVYSEDVEYFTYGGSAVGWAHDQPDGYWYARAEGLVSPDIAQSQWKAIVQADNRVANSAGYQTDVGAFCSQSLPWYVAPVGTSNLGLPTQVNLSLTFDGTLRIGPTSDPTTRVLFDAGLSVSSPGNWADLADQMHGASLSPTTGLTITSGMDGATIVDQSANGTLQYYVQHTANVSFEALTGQTIWVDFFVQPLIASDTGIGLNASADFFNTATYQLSSNDAEFELVPEPCTMTLIGLAGLALLRRRR